MFFSSVALAADPATSATQQPAPPSLNGFLPLIFFAVAFYFLLIRPNQRKLKAHENMVKALKRGDKVVTAGGVIGVISKVEDDDVVLVEIAENVKIRVMRETITDVVSKPIANDNKAEKPADKDKATSK